MLTGVGIYEIAVTDSRLFRPFPKCEACETHLDDWMTRKVGAWQLLTVVHDIFGLQAEAVIYVARSLDWERLRSDSGATQIGLRFVSGFKCHCPGSLQGATRHEEGCGTVAFKTYVTYVWWLNDCSWIIHQFAGGSESDSIGSGPAQIHTTAALSVTKGSVSYLSWCALTLGWSFASQSCESCFTVETEIFTWALLSPLPSIHPQSTCIERECLTQACFMVALKVTLCFLILDDFAIAHIEFLWVPQAQLVHSSSLCMFVMALPPPFVHPFSSLLCLHRLASTSTNPCR